MPRDFKYQIGEIINNQIITEHIEYKNRNYYKFICKKCGYDCTEYFYRGEYFESYKKLETDITRNKCPVCTSVFVAPKINSVSVTDPHIVKNFVNKEMAKKYTRSSTKREQFICTDCGRIQSELLKIETVTRHGGLKCECRDNIPYSEKYFLGLLKSISERKEINYRYQVTKKDYSWIGKYRYDFFIECKKEGCIVVETQGIQHYLHSFKGQNIEQTQSNDIRKKQLAIENGILDRNYYQIDCSSSDPSRIRQVIIKSGLRDVLDVNESDFFNAESFAMKNFDKSICAYYRNHPETAIWKIAKVFNVCVPTVSKALDKGSRLGWCDYKKIVVSYYDGKTKNHERLEITEYNPVTKQYSHYDSAESVLEYYKKSDEKFDIKELKRCCVGGRIKYNNKVFIYGLESDLMSKFNMIVNDYRIGDSLSELAEKYDLSKSSVHNILAKGNLMGICVYKQDCPNKGRRGSNYLDLVKMLKNNPNYTRNELAEKLKITPENVSAHMRKAIERGDIVLDGYSRENIDYIATGKKIESLIRDYCEKEKVKITAFPNILGLNCEQGMYRWFKGKSLPRYGTLCRMSQVLRVPQEVIIVLNKE